MTFSVLSEGSGGLFSYSRDEMTKKGIKPKDHAKENFQKMKQKEREIKAKRDEEANSQPAQPWKMRKFNEVESKVTRTVRAH